tara:strand:- start:170 stop:307 length:138 start_codon:yes stop_codon:yes gene_type:complete
MRYSPEKTSFLQDTPQWGRLIQQSYNKKKKTKERRVNDRILAKTG